MVLVVELKLREAAESDTAKNAGYFRSVKADRYILMVKDAADEDYCGFKP